MNQFKLIKRSNLYQKQSILIENISKKDRFYIEFEIDESIKSLKSESTLIDDQIRISDLIRRRRFTIPNRISLAQGLFMNFWWIFGAVIKHSIKQFVLSLTKQHLSLSLFLSISLSLSLSLWHLQTHDIVEVEWNKPCVYGLVLESKVNFILEKN